MVEDKSTERLIPSSARVFCRPDDGQTKTSHHNTRDSSALVKRHLSEQLLCHISRDATAIEGNEKPIKKKEEAPKATVPAKKGRPKKDEQRKIKEEKRLDKQVRQTAAEALQELPNTAPLLQATKSPDHPGG